MKTIIIKDLKNCILFKITETKKGVYDSSVLTSLVDKVKITIVDENNKRTKLI